MKNEKLGGSVEIFGSSSGVFNVFSLRPLGMIYEEWLRALVKRY